MLFYALPSYSRLGFSPYHPTTDPTLYTFSRPAQTHASIAYERYLRAIAEARSARNDYLRELEEARILESIRQREALYQASAYQGQVENSSRRCAAFGNGCHRPFPGACGRPQAYPRHHRARAAAGRRLEWSQTPEEQLLGALLGINAGFDQENSQEVHSSHQENYIEKSNNEAVQAARANFLRKLDAIKAKAQANRDIRAQNVQATPSAQRQSKPLGSCSPTVPLTRKPEIHRAPDRCDRAACTIQRHWRSHSADAAARRDALHTINVLRARFHFLRESFSFPEHLQFTSESGVEEPNLSYSPMNASVHSYTNELMKLLLQADGIPSGGSKQVRDERKAFVRDVEEQLEAVDVRVKKVWGKRAEGTIAEDQRTEDVAPVPVATDNGIEHGPSSEPTPEAEGNRVEFPLASPQASVPQQEQSDIRSEDSNSREQLDAPTHNIAALSSVAEKDGTGTGEEVEELAEAQPEESIITEKPSAHEGSEPVPLSPPTAHHSDEYQCPKVPPPSPSSTPQEIIELAEKDPNERIAIEVVEPGVSENTESSDVNISQPAISASEAPFTNDSLDLEIDETAGGEPGGLATEFVVATEQPLEAFDIVYPDSESSTPTGDAFRSDVDMKDAGSKNDEGFEIL